MAEELICITCPLGCRLSVEKLSDNEIRVSGNRCARGETYAMEEYLAPKRVVTATANGGPGRRIPCRTVSAFPKERIPDLLKMIYGFKILKPVKRGEILAARVLGEDIDLIATRTME